MISGPRLELWTLTAAEAERALTGAGGLSFVDGYPSAFATEVLRLVALYPATDQDPGRGTPDLGPWLVRRRSDGVVVGTVSCARLADPAAVTVGYDIATSCRGQGYATEALTTVAAHLLSLPAVWQVCAETRIDHVASRRVMEKAGMRWVRDEATEEDGRAVTLAHYALDRPRY